MQSSVGGSKNKFALCKPNSAKAADEHRHQLSKLIAARNNTDPDGNYRKLNYNIRQRKLGLKLCRINKKVKRGFVQKFVFHNEATGESTAVEDKHPMEELSEETNTKRWTAGEISPFLSNPQLLEDVGVCCEGPWVDAILNGTYEPPKHLDAATKRVLRSLAKPDIIKQNPMATSGHWSGFHCWAWQHAKRSHCIGPTDTGFFTLHVLLLQNSVC